MNSEGLKQVMLQWGLNAAQLAKVLCIHTSSLSEYLDDLKKVPCSIRFHIETMNALSKEQQQELISRRLERKAHQS